MKNNNKVTDKILGAAIYELGTKRKLRNDDEWMHNLIQTNKNNTKQKQQINNDNNKTKENKNDDDDEEDDEGQEDMPRNNVANSNKYAAVDDYLEHLINPDCVGQRLNEVVAFLSRGNVGKAKSLLNGIVKTEPEAVDLFCFRKVTECCAVFENALKNGM